jgi:multidrug resistance efflux pump
MMAVPFPLRPVMVFIPADDTELGAAFQQNALQRVGAGDEAEIAFDALPGTGRPQAQTTLGPIAALSEAGPIEADDVCSRA